MSVAIEGYGTSLGILFSGVTTVMAEVTKITGPSMKGKSIDVTNMSSPSGFMEFIPGLVDGGEITFTINHVAADAQFLFGAYRVQGISVVLTFTDGTVWTCPAFITDLGNQIPLDDKISIDVTFKVSGLPTIA